MQIDAAPLIIRELVTLPPEARAQAAATDARSIAGRVGTTAPSEPPVQAGDTRGCDDCSKTGAGTPERPGRSYQTNADGDTAELNSLSDQLSDDEQREVDELKKRDAEVRAHEAAHLAAAGSLAQGKANFEFQTGPDGNRYAVGGHVDIDTSPAETPEATLAKARQIRRAALAPGDPSSADRAVAAKAAQMLAKARRELAEQKGTTDPATREEPPDVSDAPESRGRRSAESGATPPDSGQTAPTRNRSFASAAPAGSLDSPERGPRIDLVA